MNVWTRVTTLPARRAVVVRVWGEVDHFTIEDVRLAIDEGFTTVAASRSLLRRPVTPPPPPVQVLVLDLARVTFFGSLGLVALLQAHERAIGYGMRLVVAIPPDHPIRKATRMTTIDRDVELAESVDQALAVRPAARPAARHHWPDAR